MNRQEKRLALAIGVVCLGMLLWAGGTLALVYATLDGAERAAVAAALVSRLALALMVTMVMFALVALALRGLFHRYVVAPAQLLDQTQVLLSSDARRALEPQGSAENRALTRAINDLVRERAQLRDDIGKKVAEASAGIEQERSRLAALMSELTQSVVVCNLDGRILLYNSRARLQFRALSSAPALAGGTELIGLGRSIYLVFERRLVAHALETIEQRLRRGATSPSTQFVTATSAGQLLRVQMAAVCNPANGQTPTGALSGFVLMLDNITRDFEQESLRDRLLHGLTEGSRASLANLQAAVEMLEFPDLDAAMRERFHAVIREEVGALSQRVQDVAAATAVALKTRWPLEDMLGADLVSAGRRRIEDQCGLQVGGAEVNASLWLKVDSFSLLQALIYLAGRLQAEFDIKAAQLRLTNSGQRAQFDLVWSGPAPDTATVMSWQMEPMRIGQEQTPLSVRDVVERHGGEFWFERERLRNESFFRFLLPLAAAQEQLDTAQQVKNESRPEYYDFDLFKTYPQSRELDACKLSELSYTVFDTETTGLDPSGGDEIIQIGAMRIVNGKLLKSERFEQLIDPQRSIPAASIPIHGIEPEMVRGQPTISEVLPAFHAFALDTVLVAHNAAFDMRFLELKEKACGVRFEQPVLDTLLLSALVHPNQDSHSLEAISGRLNVQATGRHTAIGDALVTAEVFLRLVPLLHERGIDTLGQARAAAQQTYLARLRY